MAKDHLFKGGKGHPRWATEKRFKNGYPKIRVGKSHPLGDSTGWCYEHLLVWVGAGNARPVKGQAIHYINENKEDNRLENLELIASKRHAQHHASLRQRDNGKFVDEGDDSEIHF